MWHSAALGALAAGRCVSTGPEEGACGDVACAVVPEAFASCCATHAEHKENKAMQTRIGFIIALDSFVMAGSFRCKSNPVSRRSHNEESLFDLRRLCIHGEALCCGVR